MVSSMEYNKKKYLSFALLSFFLIKPIYAGEKNPVLHEHGNRTHSHFLPSGGLNHSHNKNKTDENWVRVSSTDSHFFDIKSRSLSYTTTEGSKPVLVVISKSINIKNNQIKFEKNYVSIMDCKNKMGKLVTLNMSGIFKYSNDFIFSGGNASSSIAETICIAGRNYINEGL